MSDSQWFIDQHESFQDLVREEVDSAYAKHPTDFTSAHEGYAVLLEEVDELWDEVKKKEKSPKAMLIELVQIAAMAERMAVDCGLVGREVL